MYSVFVHKRPIRFAFLINPHEDQWLEQLDAICEYTLDKWRGRFNPVVPTNGETLEREWWKFLKKIVSTPQSGPRINRDFGFVG
jgi:hypothetical protein